MEQKSLLLPSTISYAPGDEPNMATLTVEPMEHGYGTTIGNALRRVLLTSLPGGALSAVKITGASHEFTTVDGVKEDAVELTLNLKQVNIKVHSENPVRLSLSKKGSGVVTAGDFAANADVEIANPDQVIATITDDKVTFEMEALASQGQGYVPVEEREKEEQEVGWIKLDALYSPVKSVAFRVEPVRIGEITNYDRLSMDIQTDGTMTAQEAVEASTEILMKHFQLLAGGEISGDVVEEEEELSESEE
ncbi:DNA-directed RNA polymerase subunit alpha [Candidatus Uhrbacteria bacterium]|jgi:DNA-directed RNA polymerase subunit alpha|nr:DNA-directed RNA polymerase subunit alpha [Candidatus Woesearchaeota archaeon]MBT6254368.1 DNA-directed RNA polymerase subunit alpha [Candidatus Uhrbacteria bacterium]